MRRACHQASGIVTPLTGAILIALCISAAGLAADAGEARESSPVASDVGAGLSAGQIEEEIAQLREAARFDEGAALARELVLLRESDPTCKPFEITDARWLLTLLERAARFPQEHRRQLALVDSLQGVADGSWDAGTYDLGLASAERRLAILREHFGPEHPEMARSLDDAGGFLDELGRLAEAEALCSDALAVRQALLGDEHPLVAESMNNLAHLARGGGDYAEAARLAASAVELYRRLYGDEHPDLAVALGNQGLYLQLQGDFEAAGPLFRESIEMQRRLLGEEHPNVATVLDNLAVLLMDMGDYAAAEPLFAEALAMRRKLLGGDHPYLAIGLSNLGVLRTAQGDYQGAEELTLEALDIRRRALGDEHHAVASALISLAVIYSERGDHAAAVEQHREALPVLVTLLGEDHPRTALCLHNLACALTEIGSHDAAEAFFLRALAARRGAFGDEHPDVAATLRDLAHLTAERGDSARAEAFYREALDIYRRTLGEGHGAVVRCLHGLGELIVSTRDYEGAESVLTEAARIYDAVRPRAGSGYTRTTFVPSPYVALAGARLLLGHEDDAWPAAERALGRSLADLLMSAEQRELTPLEATREDSLRTVLSDLERLLSACREAAKDDTTGEVDRRMRDARAALLAAEAEWSRFRADIAAKYPLTEGEAFSLGRVQASLSRQTALIGWLDVEWLWGAANTWAYVARDSGAVSWVRLDPADADATRLIERPKSLRWTLADPGAPTLAVVQEAKQLWRERIAPLAPHLNGVEQLVVVPSGPMLGLPVAALVEPDGGLLGDRYAVSYAPSATIYAWLVERDARRGGHHAEAALLVGDPPFADTHLTPVAEQDDGTGPTVALRALATDATTARSALAGNADALATLPRLAGTREEIELVAPLFPEATVLLGREASEQRLVEITEAGAMRSFGTIHLATHALVDDARPGRSALVLSQVDLPDLFESALAGDRIYDGLLTANEIVREWRIDADLVTLSACETGLGREVVGEGYIGFAHAFLQAGARCLLVSLWKVEDTATALLMRRFYENRSGARSRDSAGGPRGPMGKARALREAQSWLRTYTNETGQRPYQHPYYWSAFVLVGDPD